MGHHKGKTMKHEHSKSQQMKTSQRFWQAFIVARQAAEPGHPGKTALPYPSAWQQDKTVLGFGQLDDFQAYPMYTRCLCRLIASVSLVHESQLHVLPRFFLPRSRQFAYLSPILFIGR